MLDNILNIVKEVALDSVMKNAEIPSDKKDLTVATATDAIASGLTGNIGSLAGLLSGGGGNNSIMSSIQETVVSSLMQKVGINSSAASGLVSSMLPAVIGALTNKIGSSDDSGFSLESVLGALSGGGSQKGGLGGMLGALGGLFGK